MKKEYLKPEAEYIKFYSEEDLAALDGEKPSGSTEEGTGDESWVN